MSVTWQGNDYLESAVWPSSLQGTLAQSVVLELLGAPVTVVGGAASSEKPVWKTGQTGIVLVITAPSFFFPDPLGRPRDLFTGGSSSFWTSSLALIASRRR